MGPRFCTGECWRGTAFHELAKDLISQKFVEGDDGRKEPLTLDDVGPYGTKKSGKKEKYSCCRIA